MYSLRLPSPCDRRRPRENGISNVEVPTWRLPDLVEGTYLPILRRIDRQKGLGPTSKMAASPLRVKPPCLQMPVRVARWNSRCEAEALISFEWRGMPKLWPVYLKFLLPLSRSQESRSQVCTRWILCRADSYLVWVKGEKQLK